MNRFLILIAAGALALTACNDSKSKGDGESVTCKSAKCMAPQDPIAAEVTVPASQPLSPQEEQDFLALMKTTSNTDYGSQLLVRNDESAEDRQQREDRWRQAPDSFRRQVDTIRTQCVVNAPIRRETQTGGQGQVPRVGDKQTVEETSSIVGVSCPIAINNNSRTETTMTVVDIDFNAGRLNRLAASIAGNQYTELRIQDPMWIQQTGVRSQSMKMNMTGGMDYAGEQNHWTAITATGVGTMDFSSGLQLRMNVTAKFGQAVSGQNQRNNMSMVMVFSGHGVDKVFHLVMKSGTGMEPVLKIYLNGRELAAGDMPPGVGLGDLTNRIESELGAKAAALQSLQ